MGRSAHRLPRGWRASSRNAASECSPAFATTRHARRGWRRGSSRSVPRRYNVERGADVLRAPRGAPTASPAPLDLEPVAPGPDAHRRGERPGADHEHERAPPRGRRLAARRGAAGGETATRPRYSRCARSARAADGHERRRSIAYSFKSRPAQITRRRGTPTRAATQPARAAPRSSRCTEACSRTVRRSGTCRSCPRCGAARPCP